MCCVSGVMFIDEEVFVTYTSNRSTATPMVPRVGRRIGLEGGVNEVMQLNKYYLHQLVVIVLKRR